MSKENTPPDLKLVMYAWSGLPEAIRKAIVAMVRSIGKKKAVTGGLLRKSPLMDCFHNGEGYGKSTVSSIIYRF